MKLLLKDNNIYEKIHQHKVIKEIQKIYRQNQEIIKNLREFLVKTYQITTEKNSYST